MTQIENLKAAQLQARKNREAQRSSLLTTIIGETEMVAKNDKNREVVDEDVLKTLRKFEKNLVDTIGVLEKTDRVEQLAEARSELEIVREFLPAKLTDEQVKNDITTILQNLNIEKPIQKDQGAVVKDLRAKYGDQFDGKQVSDAFKAMIA